MYYASKTASFQLPGEAVLGLGDIMPVPALISAVPQITLV